MDGAWGRVDEEEREEKGLVWAVMEEMGFGSYIVGSWAYSMCISSGL